MRSRLLSILNAAGAAILSIFGGGAAAFPSFSTELSYPSASSKGGKPPKRRKTGHLYPHSSTRQRARYARQIAAGQLSMSGVEGGAA